jgi:hypothetical protein
MLRILSLAAISLLLTACASQMPMPLASKEAAIEAKKFATSPDYANLYVVWPHYTPSNYSGFTIIANGEELGKITNGQFINIKAAPGNYSFRIDNFSDPYPEIESLNAPYSAFDIIVTANSLGIISCSLFVKAIDDQLALMPAANCANNTPQTVGGISYCNTAKDNGNQGSSAGANGLRAYATPAASATTTALQTHCSLQTSTAELLYGNDMVAKTASINSDGNDDYDLAIQAGNASAFQSFMQAHPTSKHYAAAKSEYNRLVEVETTGAFEQKINVKLARDQVLPLGIKKDKYMLTLTKYLKNKQYQESLLYFELLDRLDVELSPSFDHFWGEALLRTNQPKEAIDKLYSYINKAGPEGNYYTQALELTNEAEAML